VPVIIFRNERLNDFILKAQYFLMIMLYSCIAMVFSVPILPLIYSKALIN